MDISFLEPILDKGLAYVLVLWGIWRGEKLLRLFIREQKLLATAVLRLLEHQDPEAARELSKDLYRAEGNGKG